MLRVCSEEDLLLMILGELGDGDRALGGQLLALLLNSLDFTQGLSRHIAFTTLWAANDWYVFNDQ